MLNIFDFEWSGQVAGFSVEGRFSYDENDIGADGVVNTEDLSSLVVRFFAPDGTLLRTYNDNHLDEGVNFNFNPESEEVLQDGVFSDPDGFNLGDGTRSDGLTFWTKPRPEVVPHLHVDDWTDELGFPIGFSSHEDVGFFTRTTQDLVDTGRVGDAYLDDILGDPDRLDDLGERIEVTPVRPLVTGSFYMAPDSFSDRIILFDPQDGSLIDDNFIDGSDDTGLGIFQTPINAIQVNDEIWVADQLADAIFSFDLAGNYLGIVNDADGDGAAEGLDNIRGMEFAEGLIYVTNSGSNNGAPGEAVVVFDPHGNNLGFFETGDPYDVRAYNGSLMINDIDEDNIDVYTIDGVDSEFVETLVDSDGENGINFPQQITVRESNANLLVAGFTNIPAFSNGGLYEFDAEGNQVDFFDSEDGFAARMRAGYELGNGNILWSGGDGFVVTNPTTGEDTDVYTVNTLDFRPSARFIEQLIVPNPDEFDLAGAVFFGDTRQDKLFLNQDLNGDGDANDPLEASVYFDETNASGFADPTGNILTILQSDGGAVFYGDGDTDSVYRLFDRNRDGDALDEGEATLWFTDSETTPLPTPNGMAEGSDGAIYIVNAGVRSRPDDVVYRTIDRNRDGDALDEGESSVWLDLQTLNPTSSAFDIEFIGDVAYISDLVGGDPNVIYRAEDRDGNGQIEGDEANIFIQEDNPFGVPVDFGITVDDENVYTWQSLNFDGPQSVYRLRDRNDSNDIDAANEAFEVWNTDSVPSGYESFNGFSIALGPDRELVVTSNGGESENNLFRLVDSNGDGDYFDADETIPYLAQSITGTVPERARAVEYAETPPALLSVNITYFTEDASFANSLLAYDTETGWVEFLETNTDQDSNRGLSTFDVLATLELTEEQIDTLGFAIISDGDRLNDYDSLNLEGATVAEKENGDYGIQLVDGSFLNDDEGVWYTEVNKNSDGQDHFDDKGSDTEIVYAAEDLRDLGDRDFNDLIFTVTVTPLDTDAMLV